MPRGGESKSSPRDAKVIAEQTMLQAGELRPIELPEEIHVEIRLVVGQRRNLTTDAPAGLPGCVTCRPVSTPAWRH